MVLEPVKARLKVCCINLTVQKVSNLNVSFGILRDIEVIGIGLEIPYPSLRIIVNCQLLDASLFLLLIVQAFEELKLRRADKRVLR